MRENLRNVGRSNTPHKSGVRPVIKYTAIGTIVLIAMMVIFALIPLFERRVATEDVVTSTNASPETVMASVAPTETNEAPTNNVEIRLSLSLDLNRLANEPTNRHGVNNNSVDVSNSFNVNNSVNVSNSFNTSR